MKKLVILSALFICLSVASAQSYSVVDMRSADTAIQKEDM